MTSSYLPRLLSICLASFFLLHLVLGTVIVLLAPALIRRAEYLRPQAAARLLLIARLIPGAVAVFLVVGLCVPSFLWLEPQAGPEEISFVCLSAAALGMTIAAIA